MTPPVTHISVLRTSAVLNMSSLVCEALSSFVQRAFSDVNDLVDVQGFTCGKFAHIV